MILWKTDEPHAQRVYYHRSEISKVSFGRDPAFVLSAGDDCSIKIWKTLEAELIRVIMRSYRN
jgi:WD40 repeat protein